MKNNRLLSTVSFKKLYFSFVKNNMLFFVLFFFNVAFSENTDSLKIKNFNQLKLELGLGIEVEFGEEAYNRLVSKLDSLNIKDEQLIDGYEWGGGQKGFEAYLINNIDSLLYQFNREIPKADTLSSLVEIDSSKILKVIKSDTAALKPVKDLTVKILPKKEIKIIKDESNKKSALSGFRLSGNLGKALFKGASLSSYSSYVEPSFFIRFPFGINIGSFLTSIGYESAKYSFESSIDTVGSYFGSCSGLLLNINISKIIKIGGEKVVKEFVVGTQSYDHGSGLVAGYNLNLILGKLPFSFSISSRFNTITFEESGGSSYWASLSAGIGLDL
ncbi:MAG: hypothetical protein ACJZ19_03950 [Candidatus Neomarinimicrobiota bacterium]